MVTLHSELALGLVLSGLVPGPAAVGPGVLGENLLDQQSAAVLLLEKVEVLRLHHFLSVMEPQHLRRRVT